MNTRMSQRTVLLRLSALIALVGLAACGVKSEPSHPEGASYPLVYPALPTSEVKPTAVQRTQQRRSQTTTSTGTGASRDASGYYTPPPPATELLVK